MRRKDREVTNLAEIYDILKRNNVIRLAINDNDYPYVIPLTFGCALENESIVIYFHCAAEGTKWNLLAKDPRVCIEADLYYKTEEVNAGVTAKYESVVGFGKAERLVETKDKVAALKCMLEHYNHRGFPVTSCNGLSKCEVFKVVLTKVTGKHNLP